MDVRIESARQLIARSVLLDVRMAAGSFSRRISSAGDMPKPKLVIQHSASARTEDEDLFVVETELVLGLVDKSSEEGTSEDPEEVPLVQVEALFELLYRQPEKEALDDEVLQAFAETNGVFNAWPYFREFVQASTVRMGLPPVLIPLFRLTPSEPNPEGPEGAEP